MKRYWTKLFKSQSSTFSTASSSGGISGNRGDILDSADLDSISGNCSEGWLSTWSWGLVSSSTSGSKLDVDGCDSELFKSVYNINSSHHSSVWWRLVSIGLDFHTTGDSGESLSSSQISNVDEGIVPSGKDVADGENVTWDVLWTKGLSWFDFLLSLLFSDFLFALLNYWSRSGLLNFSHYSMVITKINLSTFIIYF